MAVGREKNPIRDFAGAVRLGGNRPTAWEAVACAAGLVLVSGDAGVSLDCCVGVWTGVVGRGRGAGRVKLAAPVAGALAGVGLRVVRPGRGVSLTAGCRLD